MRERFGLDLVLINERLEGKAFAHEPATNRKMVELQLAPLMQHVGADAGFLFDIDSDRVALATETGEAVSEEMVLVILADDFLERGPGKIVIANVSTTGPAGGGGGAAPRPCRTRRRRPPGDDRRAAGASGRSRSPSPARAPARS